VLITVTQVNDTPVLAPIGNRTVVKGTKLYFTAKATDVDSMQTKTFSLRTPPSGATITSTGVFSWTPTTVGTFKFKVRVTDNGSPVLYDEEEIIVTVTTGAFITSSGRNAEEERNANLTLTALSNPSATYFTLVLKSNSAEPINIRMLNDLGQVVEEHRSLSSNNLIQVGHRFSAGSYLVQAQQGSERASLKLVKQ
jgi:hypothetical protein